jgi:site-specific DNA-methyltransferase (adenine-specific)
MRQVIQGDCLEILRDMPPQQVDLVYLDPPFFTQKTQSLKSRDLQEYSFEDSWETLADYLEFLRIRLQEIKRVMKNHANIFFHCDRNASHHIRILLDEIFGAERFLSEIIWIYRRWSNSKRSLLPSHQTIFMYSKTDDYLFNIIMDAYSETTNLDQILQMRVRDERGKTVYAEDEEGEIVLNGPKKGVPLSDTWQIPYLNPKAKERTGYPTQKPLLLLERIIQLASEPSQIVLDPFCGSGTTLVAAQLLERDYIGIDISKNAIELSKKRLDNPIKSESQVLQKGRQSYDNLPQSVKDVLQAICAKPIQRNSGIDAIYDQYISGQPVVIKVQRQDETLYDAATKLQKAGNKKQADLLILIKTMPEQTPLLFDDMMPKDVIVIDSLELMIHNLVQNHVAE